MLLHKIITFAVGLMINLLYIYIYIILIACLDLNIIFSPVFEKDVRCMLLSDLQFTSHKLK